jgi:transcriptional regulator with XRE-family HTH domain
MFQHDNASHVPTRTALANLQATLSRYDLTQDEVAKEAGISRSLLCKILGGTRRLSLPKLEALYGAIHRLVLVKKARLDGGIKDLARIGKRASGGAR